MASNPNDPNVQARAEARLFRIKLRKDQASERERGEVARVTAIDEKTARLKALRLAKEAQDAAAPKPAGRGSRARS